LAKRGKTVKRPALKLTKKSQNNTENLNLKEPAGKHFLGKEKIGLSVWFSYFYFTAFLTGCQLPTAF
jgi:hypothetical protein